MQTALFSEQLPKPISGNCLTMYHPEVAIPVGANKRLTKKRKIGKQVPIGGLESSDIFLQIMSRALHMPGKNLRRF